MELNIVKYNERIEEGRRNLTAHKKELVKMNEMKVTEKLSEEKLKEIENLKLFTGSVFRRRRRGSCQSRTRRRLFPKYSKLTVIKKPLLKMKVTQPIVALTAPDTSPLPQP